MFKTTITIEVTKEELQIISNAFCAMRSTMIKDEGLFQLCLDEHKREEQTGNVDKIYKKVNAGLLELSNY